MTAAGRRPSGEDLIEDLRAAAAAKGVSLTQFVAPLVSSSADNFLAQLRRSARPFDLTIERVRACVAGQPVPPARPSPFRGHCPANRHQATDSETRMPSAEIELRRAIVEAAHAARRPGETVAQAVARVTAERHRQ